MSADKLNLLSFTGKMKVLHLSWMVFFVVFITWFNMAPLLQAIGKSLNLTTSELKTLLTLNVAIAIPARIIIGMLTDKFGPRLVYAVLLAVCAIPCFMFAFADNFVQAAIARFLLGAIGAGFVVGIRIVSEWFPAHELGTAEGIYGGWGNFGSAAAAFTLPALALWVGGDDGWRYAIAATGVLCLIFSVIWYANVSNTPQGSTYFRPKNLGAMEVTSKSDFALLLIMKVPMYVAMALLAWKLSPAGVKLLSQTAVIAIYVGLAVLYAYDCWHVWNVNKEIFVKPVPELHRYKFKQVAVMDILYFATFGSELAVVSMLPLYFAETFQLTPVIAGILASAHAFMNLVSRPGGGVLSDKFGRKKMLLLLTAGLAVGYLIMGFVDSTWNVWVAVGIAVLCALFVQAGEGAVFAVVPLIKRRMTGQIAGMAGAYGNVGAVVYLTVLSFVDYHIFFFVIAGSAIIGLIALLFMEEPKGHIAEVREDGTVELISIDRAAAH
ncbi:MAG: NarK family nitrate/nitrite MFS transporter [Spongiibacteraceae bacterium]